MAAVLRPLFERPESAALDELEALREAITAEKGRVAESHRRWLLHQAAAARNEDLKGNKDAEYIALLERQNALLKKRVASLEETNQHLSEEKASILQATESSRRMLQPSTSVLSGELSRLSEQCDVCIWRRLIVADAVNCDARKNRISNN